MARREKKEEEIEVFDVKDENELEDEMMAFMEESPL